MQQLRLLLIEDSRVDAQLLLATLKGAGYDLTSQRVDTAVALTAALEQHSWDLTISDYTMPSFTGADALAIVRSHDRDLPFIFVSGTIGEETAVAAIKAGAQDYIRKDDQSRLLPAIARELNEAVVRRERTRSDERLAHLAYHDALTDLPNRLLFFDRLQQAVRSAHRERDAASLLFVDLDGFKGINDSFGHHYGDLVLQEVAARLVGTLRAADTVARLGGDEFALLLPFTNGEGAEEAARRVLAALDRPLLIDEQRLNVRASIGIATCPEHGVTAESLLEHADAAMYRAKAHEGSAVVCYSAENEVQPHHRFAITADVRSGLATGQFFVEYQPIVNLHSGAILGVEALARWQHPDRGRLLPIDFIEAAEQTGMVDPLMAFVLETAMTDWSPRVGTVPLKIAVNLSPKSLHDVQLPDRIRALLESHGMSPSMLELEITENVLMWDSDRSIACLRRLRDMGIRLVMDDFGTGYSSLSALRRLPVHQLKIDRSLVSDLASDEKDDLIVQSTIELAHNLGLTVVGEGVESDAVYQELQRLGCDAAQGFFISIPKPVHALRRWIARHRRRPLANSGVGRRHVG